MLPVLMLVPVLVSVVHLIALWWAGELGMPQRVLMVVWLLGAAYLQFRVPSPPLSVAGLLLQVVLAIYLRLKVTG
jgi:hypothetical protein